MAQNLSISVADDQVQALELIAQDRRVSVSAVARWALDEYLKAHPLTRELFGAGVPAVAPTPAATAS